MARARESGGHGRPASSSLNPHHRAALPRRPFQSGVDNLDTCFYLWRRMTARAQASIESSRAPEPVGAFPHAKRVGNLLFLSGIGPRVRGSKEIPGVTLDVTGHIVSYDIEAQCRAVFENVRLVLEDVGATWQDIIDVTVFLTNMKKDFPIYNR